jgi:flagellar basal body-associated protein FliL
MIVNLRVPDGNKYLKVSFEFELSSEDVLSIADTRKATVKARINNFLSDLTVDETVGSQNRQFIAERLLARINNDMERYANGPMFRSVVFPVFLVQ